MLAMQQCDRRATVVPIVRPSRDGRTMGDVIDGFGHTMGDPVAVWVCEDDGGGQGVLQD